MERPAKERLIGAVVIVTVAWLLIPVFLDERGGESDAVVARELALPDPASGDGASIRRETVPLDAAQTGTTVTEPPKPATVTTLPVPDVSGASPSAVPVEDEGDPGSAGADDGAGEAAGRAARTAESAPATPEPGAGLQAEPEPEPEPEQPAPAAEPKRDTGGQLWAVQLGSFSDRDNAQRLAERLRGQGYPAFLSQVQTGGRTLHRVRVGPQSSREAAAEVAAELARAGQTGRVAQHP